MVVAHTLINHVADPAAVLNEARRVGVPGGMVAVFDGDYASLTFAHPDAELATRVEAILLELLINNPRVMRDLPRLAREAGLTLIEATAHAYADVGSGSFFANIPESYATILSGSGLLPAEDAECWRAWQARAVAEGVFFGACNYDTYVLRRPGEPAT